ncbi:MAG: hypothetical protein K2K64_08705 [Muribaculaceae bacterium]|nr:hypothetical protein [Muribaculaceae bacterium]
MKTNTILMPLRGRSADGDLICNNGELESFSGVIPLIPGENLEDMLAEGDPLIQNPSGIRRPSVPRIEFSLLRTILPGWSIHPESLPAITVAATDLSEENQRNLAATTLSEMLSAAAGENLFAEPFLVLAAFRTKGGFHISPTPPILMIPNSSAPIVETMTNAETEVIRMSITAAICRLQYRLSPIDDLEEWNDHISHLDIFISSPIPLYERKAPFRSVRRTSFSGFTHSLSPSGAAGEIKLWQETIATGFSPAPFSEGDMTRALVSTSTFHLISAIPLQSIPSTTDFSDVPFNCGGSPLSSPYPSYRPDYAHLSTVEAAGATELSGRTTIFDLTVTPPAPLPLKYSTPYCNQVGYIPRFLFHPDKWATAYTFSYNGVGMQLPLQPHPSLHGAISVRPLNGEYKEATSIPPYIPSPRHYPDMIWRSTKGEHLLFPDDLLIKTEAGNIVALERAFRASGLVATTSPTAYLFTSEGVFLIKEMNDGTFRDAGLITRHRAHDRQSIIMGENGLAFVTDAGRTIRIEGTKVYDSSYASSEKLTLIGKGEDVEILTRPLKLNGNGNHPRLLSISFGGTYDPSATSLTLEGSMNLRQWNHVATSHGGEISGIWPPLYPYFRLLLTGTIPEGDTICAITARLKT